MKIEKTKIKDGYICAYWDIFRKCGMSLKHGEMLEHP